MVIKWAYLLLFFLCSNFCLMNRNYCKLLSYVILVSANPGPFGKWPLKWRERERERERERHLFPSPWDFHRIGGIGENMRMCMSGCRWRYCAARRPVQEAQRRSRRPAGVFEIRLLARQQAILHRAAHGRIQRKCRVRQSVFRHFISDVQNSIFKIVFYFENTK